MKHPHSNADAATPEPTCVAPAYQAQSVTASGIGTIFEDEPVVDVILSEEFDVAPGIHASLQEVINEFNFAVVQVLPTGAGAEVQAAIAHRGVAETI